MIENVFQAPDVANKFNQYNDILENTLGYHAIFADLSAAGAHQILDYGCGPGKVAERLAKRGDYQITAVDDSAEMITLAKTNRPHPAITYQQIVADHLATVPDNTFDAVMMCYVVINTVSEQRIQKMFRECYRVLRPGGQFQILDTNPQTTGIPFSTFQNGRTGYHYANGEARQEWLKLAGADPLVLNDYHWQPATYASALASAGFSEWRVCYPSLVDCDDHVLAQSGHHFGSEKTVAPFMRHIAIK